MARTILTHAALAVLLLLPATAAVADPAAPRTSYRTAQVLTVDAEGHRIGVDFGTGATVLDVEANVSLAGVASGDSVLIAVRETAPHPRVTYLHRSGSTSVGVAAFPGTAVGAEAGSPAVRRPMMLVPNPKPRGASGVALASDTGSTGPVPALALVPERDEPSGKVSAVVRTETEPEPAAAAAPVPSSVDALRAQGVTDLERSLTSVERLAHEADVAWNMYAAACPGAGTPGTRAWLTLAPVPPGGQDTCDASRRRVATLAEKVREVLRGAEDHARADWVTPGQLRESLQRHGFDPAP